MSSYNVLLQLATPCCSYLSSLLFVCLFPFLRGFCLRWRDNHGALRVTGSAVFFSSSGRPTATSSPTVARSSSSPPPPPSSPFLSSARFNRAKRRPRPAEVIPSPTRNDKIVRSRQPPSTITDSSSGWPRTQHRRSTLHCPRGVFTVFLRCMRVGRNNVAKNML